MGWMLVAAGIASTGARGAVRAQALALVWARVMRVWLHDDDPGLAKTMAALDKRLREAERTVMCIDRVERIFRRRGRSARARPEAPENGEIAEAHPT
jgi:hypothetical protein